MRREIAKSYPRHCERSNPLSPDARIDGLLRSARNDGMAALSSSSIEDLLTLRRIFPQKALEILLHGIRQRDRIAHMVDRAVEAEAHHAREFGLAIRLGQQQHAFAKTHARIKCTERVARGVEHPERPA